VKVTAIKNVETREKLAIFSLNRSIKILPRTYYSHTEFFNTRLGRNALDLGYTTVKQLDTY
jgi:hypothetical protein